MKFTEYAAKAIAPQWPALYGRTTPFAPLVAQQLHGSLHTREIHALGLYEINDLAVSGRGHLRYEGQLLECQDLMPEYWRNVLEANGFQVVDAEKALPTRRIAEKTIVFMGYGTTVYGHVIVEMMPRLQLAKAMMGNDFYRCKLLINDTSLPWLIPIMASLIEIDASQLIYYSPASEQVLLSHAVVPTFCTSSMDFHPAACGLVDQMVSHAKPPSGRTFGNVYMSRRMFAGRDGAPRSCRNPEEIEAIFKQRSFDVVHPEQLDFAQQLAIFQNGRSVCGIAGSALHTAMFCGPGTRIGSLGFMNGIQSSIAALRSSEIGFLDVEGLLVAADGFAVSTDKIEEFLSALDVG